VGQKLSGIIGSAIFTGRMVEFHPFLLLGEYLHVGKGTAYGFLVTIGWREAPDGLQMSGTRVNLRQRTIDGSY
jgi:hypothetical protein